MRKLDPIAFASAVRAFEAARPEPKPDEDAQQEIADCDAKLRQHRAALEAGADPVLVTSWMKETRARRALAEARLNKPAVQRRRMTQEEITNLVTGVRCPPGDDECASAPCRCRRAIPRSGHGRYLWGGHAARLIRRSVRP
jgi:hypothetical protein